MFDTKRLQAVYDKLHCEQVCIHIRNAEEYYLVRDCLASAGIRWKAGQQMGDFTPFYMHTGEVWTNFGDMAMLCVSSSLRVTCGAVPLTHNDHECHFHPTGELVVDNKWEEFNARYKES